MKEKVAVYFRCSTDKQDKSIADQRAVLVQYAQKNNMVITVWFDQDEGRSGTSFEKRPDFMRMVRMVESGKSDFKRILVYDVDRWGRPIDPDESTYWEYHFKRYGVQVTYISDESINDNSLAGRLTKKIKQELATEESHKQSLRVRERSKLRAAEGFRVGGFAPFGFKRLLVEADGTPIKVLEHGERKYEKHQRVILTPGDSQEIEVVKRIYAMTIAGKGVRAIMNILNKEGIPAPSAKKSYKKMTPGKWGISSVWRILHSPIYKGDWVYNKQARGSWVRNEEPSIHYRDEKDLIIKENAHEGIVSAELFERVNSDLKEGGGLRPSGISYRSSYLLSGLIKCSNCGYNFHGHTRSVNGKKYRYYEDSGFNLHGDSTCIQTMIRGDKIEKFILAALGQNINKVVNKRKLTDLMKKRLECHLNPDNTLVQEIKRQIEDTDNRIENLKDSLEKGVDIKFIADRLKKLDLKKTRLEEELRSSMQQSLHADDLGDVIQQLLDVLENSFDLLGSSNPQLMKTGLRALIDRVEVDPYKKKALFYVNQIPRGTKAYDDFLSVSLCRRSGRVPNRQNFALSLEMSI